MIGEIVTVAEPVDANGGRVHLADGVWPARGPATAAGTRMRIAAVDHGVVIVEPID